MRQFQYIFILFLSLSMAQSQNRIEDDLGDVSDDFQKKYFEALQEKSIENYEKAIPLLLECVKINPKSASAYFELGKNYFELDQYLDAEKALKMANELKPENQWIIEQLYVLYKAQNIDEEVIFYLKELTKFHPRYKESLATFYFRKRDYLKALEVINEIDIESGRSLKRENKRYQVYSYGKMYEKQVEYINEKIEQDLATERDYLKLIGSYSKLKQSEKSFQAASQFKEAYPNSDKPYISLYKFYLKKNDIELAKQSLYKVVKSSELTRNEKFKVANNFFTFAIKQDKYIEDLNEITKLFNHPSLVAKLTEYYASKNEDSKTDGYIESLGENIPSEFQDLQLLGDLLIKKGKLDRADKVTSKALELYPAQPIFYLQRGKLLNAKNAPNDAIEALLFGLEYLIDNVKLEADFYTELAKSYDLLGDQKNKQKYLTKKKTLNG